MSLHVLCNDIEQRWNLAAQRWNPSGLASIYAEDAVFHGGRESHSVGRVQIRQYFESYSSIFEGMSIRFVDQEIRSLSPPAFLAQGYGEFSFVFRNGERSANRLRTTLVLMLVDAEWQIALQHFSPIPDAPPLGN